MASASNPKASAPNERLVCAEPDDHSWIALVVKRTYQITPDGKCKLAGEQEPIVEGSPDYEEVEAPKVSAPSWDSDLLAFKAATDVVVQGHAYAYKPRPSADVELRFGKTSRIVRAFGERRIDGGGKHAKLSPALSFEKMPLRYERAFGGCDAAALKKLGDPGLDAFGDREPDWQLGAQTRFHYPRNLAGCGYVMEHDADAPAAVPNFEFPDDPVTPERMAVGEPENWLSAPLPAGFDWFDPRWFPRAAYIGAVADYSPPRGPVPEVARRWAPADVLELPSLMALQWNPGFLQAASPGLSVHGLAADAVFQLRGFFPKHPDRSVQLPGALGKATLQMTASKRVALEPHLAAVVFRPDQDQVICVWNARAKVDRPYAESELSNMTWSIG